VSQPYIAGKPVRITATCYAVSDLNTPADPSGVEFRVKKVGASDSTIESFTYALATVTKSTTGVYYIDYSPATAGRWKFVVLCSGVGFTANSVEIDVADVF